MNFKKLFAMHQHYWGIPYSRTVDNRLVQTCYECGEDRDVKVELRVPTTCESAKL